MRKWKVCFKVYLEDKKTEYVTVDAEADTKKMATIRAMLKVNTDEKYKHQFKDLISVEEVA